MSFDFLSARHWAQALIRRALPVGGRAIDATMGNGHDTLWLCELVGAQGFVYAFDVQPRAIEATKARLAAAGFLPRAQLHLAGHEQIPQHVRAPVDAAMFNLGWLPGGDKTYTTRSESTLTALNACLPLLKPQGLVTVCAYPGHEEGARELEAVKHWARALDGAQYEAMTQAFMNQSNHPPVLITVRKKR